MTWKPWDAELEDTLEAERARRQRDEDGPTDDEQMNRYGVEGGIAYDTTADEPGSLGENDWRL